MMRGSCLCWKVTKRRTSWPLPYLYGPGTRGGYSSSSTLFANDNKGQTTKQKRKDASPLQLAHAWILLWLRREPSWQVDTLAQFPKTMRTKHLYADSLPSFTSWLKHQQQTYDSDNSDQSTVSTNRDIMSVLETIVQNNLANQDLLHRYRGFGRDRKRQRQQVTTEIKAQTRKLKAAQTKRDRTTNQLEELRGQQPQTTEATEFSFLNLHTTEQVQQQLSRRLDDLKYLERDIQTIQKKLASLQEHAQKLSVEPLSPKELEAIANTMEAVQPTIVHAFADHVRSRHATLLQQHQQLDERTDLTRPDVWYPRTRLIQRKVVFHGGPTNSGKTYEALERLKRAKKGMYLGPLRLLAAEVYEKLSVDGTYCNLYTGQEVREIPFATHGAATVEMALLTEEYDVVVLDEIQMIEDPERGFAWTRALLGSQCSELHLCGGLEAEPIVRKLLKSCGDELQVKTYERFTPLTVAKRSLSSQPDQKGSYKKVQPGDCVVAFSRDDIFAIKREIETTTNHKCCVIYGSLPPSTRSEEARRFNDPNSGYDVLVASDAIAMGLNLSIKRIIFNSIYKNNGHKAIRLGHSAIKQISGRAGRRNSPFPVGEVTTRDPRDLKFVTECLTTEIPPVKQAGLLPTASHIETFSRLLDEMNIGKGSKSLHSVLKQFNQMADVKGNYFVCRQREMMEIAKQLSRFDLTVPDKYVLCLSPVNTNNSSSMALVSKFAGKLAKGEVPGLSHHTIPKRARNFSDLARLCHIFSELDLFLWLQKKFPPANLMERQSALSRREQSAHFIGEGLQIVRFNALFSSPLTCAPESKAKNHPLLR